MLLVSSFLPSGVSPEAVFDGNSHKLSTLYPNLPAAQADYPFATLSDEAAFCAIRKAWDAAESVPVNYRPPVFLDVPGIGLINRPLVLPANLHFYGLGRANSRLRAFNCNGGPLLAALSTAQLTDIGPNGFGPIGDENGFILGNRGLCVIDFADRVELFRPPPDWSFEIELRWDEGADVVWSLGNRLATGVGQRMQVTLQVTIAGFVIARANDDAVGVLGPQLTPGVFYTVGVTVSAQGALMLTVNGVDYVAPGVCPPLVISWFTSLIINACTDTFPWGIFRADGGLKGRVRNARLANTGLTLHAPLTDGNTPFFAIHPGLGGDGFLYARPQHTFAGPDRINLHDFFLEGAGQGVGLYINNVQNSTIERLDINNFQFGAIFHKNTYSDAVANCQIQGHVCAAMGVVNAGQTPWDNCTFYGGSCGFASEGSYASEIRGGWIVNVFGPNSVHLLLSGAGATHSVSALTMFNEGTDPRWIALLRDTQASFFGCSMSRYSLPVRNVVTVDGGGPYTFHGGKLSAIPGGVATAFEFLRSAEVHLFGVDPGPNSPPWAVGVNHSERTCRVG